MGSSMLDEDLVPIDVRVDDQKIRVTFRGGLELATPTMRYPRLQNAAPEQRVRWELVGRSSGIHWPDADEDISIRGLFATARQLPESAVEQVPFLISDLLKTTGRLNTLFEHRRPFTPDGHLVGSIGEVVAEYIYDLDLEPCSTPQVDAFTKGRPKLAVQIKLTGANGRSFGLRWPVVQGRAPDVLLCMRMTPDGFKEIYNGPFPADLLERKTVPANGQISLQANMLGKINHVLLPHVRSFDSINRWFQAAPELAEVA